jgi:predicted RNase H-like HicB family nuclease
MTEYAVVIEDAGKNFAAYVPDLPGCVSTGASLQEVTGNIQEAIALHMEALRDQGEVVPPSTSRVATVQVA